MSAQAAGDLPLAVIIEPLQKRHLKQVVKIEEACFIRPWSLALFVSELSMPATRAYFIAKAAGEIIGFGGLMMTGDDCHITTIAVEPEYQNRRVARQILLALVDEAISRGGRAITLEVRTSNLPAQILYKRFGFTPVGIRKNYYVETREDALIMWVRGVDKSAYAERLALLRRQIAGGRPRRWREARQ